jgi:hypothetical protein
VASLGSALRLCATHGALVAGAGELAIIFGHRILITGRNLGRVGVADGAAVVFVELVAKLQFQSVHAADKLLVHLLHQAWIAWETAGIEIAHFINQGLQFLARLRTILHDGTNLVEQVQSLIDLALRIGRVRCLLGRHGTARDAGVPGVVARKRAASAIRNGTAGISYWTRDAIADTTRLSSAWLPCWLSARLSRRLAILPVARKLAGLEWLTAGLCTSLTGWLTAGLSGPARLVLSSLTAQSRELVAQAR